MKTAIVNAMITPYDGPIKPEDSIFLVNGAFRHQRFNKNQDVRIFAMDDLSYLPRGWDDEINMLPEKYRYIATQHFETIPRSEPYPIVEIVRYFNNARFFTSTFAYIMALAIYEKFDRIILSGAHFEHDSEEYITHLPCINFWAGMAMGAGIKVEVHGPCVIARPYAWEPGFYGYVTNANREVVHVALAAAARFANSFPYEEITHVDVDKMLDEFPSDKLMSFCQKCGGATYSNLREFDCSKCGARLRRTLGGIAEEEAAFHDSKCAGVGA